MPLARAQAQAQQAHGTSRAAARSLGYAGVESYQKGRYADASAKLERAYEVIRAPAIGLWSARSLVKLGKWVEGAERYLEVTRLDVATGDAKIQKKAQLDAEREREELLPKIPALVVSIEGAAASQVRVTLDGKLLESALIGAKLPVNPGAHHIEAELGEQRVARDATLAEAEVVQVSLPIQARQLTHAAVTAISPQKQQPQVAPVAAENGSSTQDTLGWVALGVGGVGLATLGVTSVLMQSKKSDFESSCEARRCSPEVADDVNAYMTLRTVSTVGFAVGVVGVASGLTLLLTAPSPANEEASINAWVGLDSAGVKGRF